MKSKARSRTEDLIAKLEAVKLSPLEVLQRSLAMAEANNDYKHMSETALSILPYTAPTLKASEVVVESSSINRNVDMSMEELDEELKRLEELERLAGLKEETKPDEDAE